MTKEVEKKVNRVLEIDVMEFRKVVGDPMYGYIATDEAHIAMDCTWDEGLLQYSPNTVLREILNTAHRVENMQHMLDTADVVRVNGKECPAIDLAYLKHEYQTLKMLADKFPNLQSKMQAMIQGTKAALSKDEVYALRAFPEANNVMLTCELMLPEENFVRARLSSGETGLTTEAKREEAIKFLITMYRAADEEWRQRVIETALLRYRVWPSTLGETKENV